ncbi:unnamed protein product [Lepidochelys kempii]
MDFFLLMIPIDCQPPAPSPPPPRMGGKAWLLLFRLEPHASYGSRFRGCGWVSGLGLASVDAAGCVRMLLGGGGMPEVRGKQISVFVSPPPPPSLAPQPLCKHPKGMRSREAKGGGAKLLSGRKKKPFCAPPLPSDPISSYRDAFLPAPQFWHQKKKKEKKKKKKKKEKKRTGKKGGVWGSSLFPQPCSPPPHRKDPGSERIC